MAGTTIPYDNMSTPEKSWPLFTKCCFCIPLRTGCFIMGYFSLVIKLLHTITLIGLIAYFGYTTHGFDHFNMPEGIDDHQKANLVNIERPILKRAELYFVIALLANFIWLFVNIGCLVGLHKKRPGPVRLYVSFATFKLILSLVAIVYLLGTNKGNLITIIAELFIILLSAHFILVYYVYVNQLERQEQDSESVNVEQVSNISHIYPTKLDKKTLVA
ncbi:uncharacterized protein LOC131854579 isoform X1 [Achroia grisella]|uniref:uncharacterized protein LOC131854579 isoform X1 n=1 Tax=Achroia grisella TaxID=688607 RepID=UPI0027D33803|nr:uncharacterized protein LOC131854579 isoform X1 [Achroia grisella]